VTTRATRATRAAIRGGVLLGAATGSRSTMGLAALGLTARSGWLAHRPVRIGLAAAAGAELVIDKLPITPSRLQSRGLISRLVGGTACGAIVGYRGHKPADAALAAAAGGASALAFAFVGSQWRRFAAGRAGHDLPGAVAEDIASATLALVGALL
jgi:uncharacterized membrane protein